MSILCKRMDNFDSYINYTVFDNDLYIMYFYEMQLNGLFNLLFYIS